MRIVTWNCQGAFRRKAEAVARFAPDLAVIEECEPLEKLKFPPGVAAPTAQLWFGDTGGKGLGIFSYTDLKLTVSKTYNPAIRYCVPIRVSGPHRFNLIAVWAMNHKDRKLSYVGQVHLALHAYAHFIRRAETVLMGDFNSNSIWDGERLHGSHGGVVRHLAARHIHSIYHAHFGEAHGAESRNTFFLQRNRAKGYHLDYCFVPQRWLPRLQSLTVGSYADWIGLSDHCPLFVEFDQLPC
jgi:exonuclease III